MTNQLNKISFEIKESKMAEGDYLHSLISICLSKAKEVRYNGNHFFNNPPKTVLQYEDDFLSVEKSTLDGFCSVILYPPLVQVRNPIISMDNNKKLRRFHGEILYFKLYVERLFDLDLITKIYYKAEEKHLEIMDYVSQTKQKQDFS